MKPQTVYLVANKPTLRNREGEMWGRPLTCWARYHNTTVYAVGASISTGVISQCKGGPGAGETKSAAEVESPASNLRVVLSLHVQQKYQCFCSALFPLPVIFLVAFPACFQHLVVLPLRNLFLQGVSLTTRLFVKYAGKCSSRRFSLVPMYLHLRHHDAWNHTATTWNVKKNEKLVLNLNHHITTAAVIKGPQALRWIRPPRLLRTPLGSVVIPRLFVGESVGIKLYLRKPRTV